jgi:membrane protease YdiL (CAAX protease family)
VNDRPGRDALIAWAIVLALVAGLVRIDIQLPAIGHLGSALVAVVFLYAPVVVAWWRKEDLDDYGFHAEPVRKGLVIAGTAIAVIFPIFALGYFAFYEIACNSQLLAHLVPRNMCSSYGGLSALHWPAMNWNPLDKDSFAQFCLVQMIVVALPEELFFRGFLLHLLEKRFPPRRRVLGGGIGLALVLSAAAFALIHLPKDGDPRALATFFPALVFGWMRSATGSILASTVTHGASNILIWILDHSVLR